MTTKIEQAAREAEKHLDTRQLDGDGGEEVIECHKCHQVLNGRSLWVTCEANPKILCEVCHEQD